MQMPRKTGSSWKLEETWKRRWKRSARKMKREADCWGSVWNNMKKRVALRSHSQRKDTIQLGSPSTEKAGRYLLYFYNNTCTYFQLFLFSSADDAKDQRLLQGHLQDNGVGAGRLLLHVQEQGSRQRCDGGIAQVQCRRHHRDDETKARAQRSQ